MRLLILDACVLIDLYEADPDILVRTTKQVGEVHVASTVLAEVRQISQTKAKALGMTVVEPELRVTQEAATRRGSVSVEDWISILMARDNGWTCVTNDRAVHRVSLSEGVETWWGLQILLRLVQVGALSKTKARQYVTAIQERNPFISQRVVDGFLVKLGR